MTSLSNDGLRPLPAGDAALPPERFALLLRVATMLFLQNGYGRTHMSAIAAAAGMSKKTLYKAFASKEDLLRAGVTARLAALTTDLESGHAEGLSPEATLTRSLTMICAFALSPDVVGLYRLVLTEGSRFPELIGAYMDEHVMRGRDVLARWIEERASEGPSRVEDPRLLAGMLIHMITAEPLREIILGLRASVPEDLLAKRVEQAVALFFHGATKRDVDEAK